MSFTNPFAQSLGTDDTATVEYFSGNPNPQSLESPEFAMIVKNLMRKDQTTREKASSNLIEMIPLLDISDSVHLAWVQLYAKLSFDISPHVRAQSHLILGEIYAKIGKKASKYLKSTLPELICGLYDPIASVQSAATSAFESSFNTEERRSLAIEKLTPELNEFCANVILSLQPQTISDERYISKEESNLKYDRMVKQVIDVISNVLLKQNTENISQLHLLDNSKLWDHMYDSNVNVAKATLNLSIAAINHVDTQKIFMQLVKAMNKGRSVAPVELIRAILTYVKSFPDYWNEKAQSALISYVKNSSSYPQPFWPLYFNLIILNGGLDKLMASALASCAVHALGPTQADVWGCFLTLCTRFESIELATIACNAIAARTQRGEVGPGLLTCIASRFKTFKRDLVLDSISKHIKDFNFALILSATQNYSKELSVVAQEFTLAQLARLVRQDPAIEAQITGDDYKSILDIAAHSNVADSQAMALLVLENEPELLLEYSEQLYSKGVRVNLDNKLDLNDPVILKKVISAHDGLVDGESAKAHVWSLATNALEGGSHSLNALSDLALTDGHFIQKSLGNTDLGSKLLTNLYLHDQRLDLEPLFKTLNLDDSSDALVNELLNGDIQNLDVMVDRARNLSSTSLSPLLLLDKQWLPTNIWPAHSASVKYPVRYKIEESVDDQVWDRILRITIFLVNLINDVQKEFDDLPQHQQDQCIANIALVSSACVGLEYSSSKPELVLLAKALRADAKVLASRVNCELLWDFVSSSDSSTAYYAAQLLFPLYTGKNNSELCTKYRAQLNTSSICAALLAQLHAGLGIHWYDRTQKQFYSELESGKQFNSASFACVDSSVDTEKFIQILHELTESVDEPLLQEVLIELTQLEPQHILSDECVERVLEYGQSGSKLIVLCCLEIGDFEREIVHAATEILDSGSEQSSEVVEAFLRHCKPLLYQDIGFDIKKTSSNPSIAWVYYCCTRGRVCSKYRKQLEESNFEDTKVVGMAFSDLQKWFLYLDLVQEYNNISQSLGRKAAPSSSVFSEYDNVNADILNWIGTQLSEGVLDEFNASTEFEISDAYVSDAEIAVINLFYRMCTLFGASVRQWYRNLGDRTLRKVVDQCLKEYISPAILRSLAKQVQDLRQDGTLEATSVSERAREFRAMIDIDEAVAQIVISLDPLFPAKMAVVQLVDLAGVPEHKKRSWSLEAEYTVQSGAIVDAMRTLCMKVNNFLEGFEPCAICYAVMLGKMLPNKTCSTCKNTYHSDCLYKWFHSNQNKQCPMCRSNM